MSERTSQAVLRPCDICNTVLIVLSDLKNCRMEIQNSITTHSEPKKL